MIVAIRSGATEESEYEMASGMRYQASLFSEWSRMAEKSRGGEFLCAPVTRPGACFQFPVMRIEQRPDRFY